MYPLPSNYTDCGPAWVHSNYGAEQAIPLVRAQTRLLVTQQPVCQRRQGDATVAGLHICCRSGTSHTSHSQRQRQPCPQPCAANLDSRSRLWQAQDGTVQQTDDLVIAVLSDRPSIAVATSSQILGQLNCSWCLHSFIACSMGMSSTSQVMLLTDFYSICLASVVYITPAELLPDAEHDTHRQPYHQAVWKVIACELCQLFTGCITYKKQTPSPLSAAI